MLVDGLRKGRSNRGVVHAPERSGHFMPDDRKWQRAALGALRPRRPVPAVQVGKSYQISKRQMIAAPHQNKDTEDALPGRVEPTHSATTDIGPVYAVRNYIKRARTAFANGSREFKEWLDHEAIRTKRPLDRGTIGAVADSYRALLERQICYSIDMQATSRLGKHAVRIVSYTGEAVTLETYEGDGEDEDSDRSYCEDVIFVRRSELTIMHNRIEFHDSPAHFAINRHGLERLYARGKCTLETFDKVLGDAVMATIDCLSIAHAIQLTTGVHATETAVPFGDGLVIVDSRLMVDVFAEDHWTSARLIAKNGKIWMTEPYFNKYLTSLDTVDGRAVTSSVVYVTRTYLGPSELSSNRAQYLALFHRLCDQIDGEQAREDFITPHPRHAKPDTGWYYPASADGLITRLKARLEDGVVTGGRGQSVFAVRELGTASKGGAQR
jgi:hypothetical protein